MSNRLPKFKAILILISLTVALGLSEGVLRLIERNSSRRFNATANLTSENFFYYRRIYEKAGTFDNFDPVLGWRGGVVGSTSPTINRQGWRSSFDFREEKTKKRVILTGDSFTFGWGGGDRDTIASHLQTQLGESYEVMNMAAAGWAIDQMAVLATEVAPRYKPDYVILGFIGHDLVRSCRTFAWGMSPKPYFIKSSSGLRLAGVPLRNPLDVKGRYETFSARFKDFVAVQLSRSRVLNLIAEPYIQFNEEKCRSHLNAEILAYTKERYRDSPIIFAHIDGELPKEFLENLRRKNVSLISIPDEFDRVRRQINAKPERADGYHPDGEFNRLIAHIYWEQIQKRESDTKRIQ